MEKFNYSFDQDEAATFLSCHSLQDFKLIVLLLKGFRHLQSKTEVILLEVTSLDCSVVGNFHFCRVKRSLAPRLMMTRPKIVMLNKMANNL